MGVGYDGFFVRFLDVCDFNFVLAFDCEQFSVLLVGSQKEDIMIFCIDLIVVFLVMKRLVDIIVCSKLKFQCIYIIQLVIQNEKFQVSLNLQLFMQLLIFQQVRGCVKDLFEVVVQQFFGFQ